jgi:hypothetical protein
MKKSQAAIAHSRGEQRKRLIEAQGRAAAKRLIGSGGI